VSTIQRLSLSTDVPTNIEVWQLTLNLQMPVSHLDFSLLNESERNRALRFRAHEDQVRSIVTRAALRRLLAQKIMRQPEKLNFVTNEYGKPSLQSDTDIQFNVSHAGCFALLAFSTGGSIGVDIESCNRQIDINGLGKYVFTALERTS
jgi:4'-phosphopantetheinyl transferase